MCYVHDLNFWHQNVDLWVISQSYIFKCRNVQPTAAPDEVARVSEMSSTASVSQSLWRSHPQQITESQSQCFTLLKSGKIHSQTKHLRVWLCKYRCRSIAVLFSVLARGLFNTCKRWAERRRRIGIIAVMFCRRLFKKTTTTTTKKQSTKWQVLLFGVF